MRIAQRLGEFFVHRTPVPELHRWTSHWIVILSNTSEHRSPTTQTPRPDIAYCAYERPGSTTPLSSALKR